MYDLCCGKSYLSFAAYSHLADICGREVKMICVDRKASVMDFCRQVAEKLGYSGMSFICDDIRSLSPDGAVDLVLSLHACDTATDVVLDFAVRAEAGVILSTPCCQHEMFKIMDCPDLGFISKYSILKQKIASAATDALRLLKLETEGYSTDAIELIDPDETPKNVLLRGIKKKSFDRGGKQAAAKREEYEKAYIFMTGEIPKSDRA